MSNTVKPKAAAAHRGCLSARHWQDIRRAARLARSEGVTLIMYGVTVDPTARSKENLLQSELNSTSTPARGGRGLKPKETIGNACEYPTAKQHEQPPKQQRAQRSLLRLHEHQRDKACGARWSPLVQMLLRKERAISRASVWTGHMEHKIALRDKMRDFVARALHDLPKRALAVRDHSAKTAQVAIGDPVAKLRHLVPQQSQALGAKILRRLASQYRDYSNRVAGHRVMDPVHLHFLLINYRQQCDVEAAFVMIESESASIIPKLDQSPPGRRSTQRYHTHTDLPLDRGEKHAESRPKKSRGGRSRRR